MFSNLAVTKRHFVILFSLMIPLALINIMVHENYFPDMTKLVSVWKTQKTIGRFVEFSDSDDDDTGNHKVFRDVFNIAEEPPVEIGPDNETDKDRYFIYRCDDSTLTRCGGLMDRFKSGSAAYMIANLTGRTFKFELLMRSCDFHKYIVPNRVDWYLPVSFHKTVTPNASVSTIMTYNVRDFINKTDLWADESMNHKFVYFRGNQNYFMSFKYLPRYDKQLSWMNDLTDNQIINTIYRRLFRPSAYLQHKTKAFFKENLLPNERLVCLHLRTGPNPTMPQDGALHKISQSSLETVWKFLKAMIGKNNSKIFLMSDNERLIKDIKAMSFGSKIFTTPGKIVHIDKSPDFPDEMRCQGLEKITFEFYILLHCDVLLISHSSIGVHAASVRNTDEGLYCLLRSGDLRKCKREDLHSLYVKKHS